MKFMRNEEGFTGLEAAIVLIAFVVVAAVFSYVMLGAGFFTSQKSQEVVHTSVQQASSSVEVVGDVIGKGDATGTKLTTVIFTIATTAGGSSFNLNNLLVTLTDEDGHETIAADTDSIKADNTVSEVADTAIDAGQWGVIKYLNNQDGVASGTTGFDVLVEPGEQVVLAVKIPTSGTITSIGPNTPFTIELRPSEGATLQVAKTAPPQIDLVNILY
jgi:flagellin FlaB